MSFFPSFPFPLVPIYSLLIQSHHYRQALLTPDERLLYSHIEASAGEGIWTKTLKARSNLHQTTINKCLKSLETKRFIKPIKSKQHPTRKIYMLYELTPSIEVTGGPWFTDGELDDEFVTELTSVLERYIHGRTFLKGTSTPYPPGYSGYATLESLTRWIKQAGVTEVDLSSEDVKSLLDCLVYDGRIEKVGGVYKAVRGAGGENASNNGFTESPCGRCPVFALCEEGGPVNAGNCVYYAEWLNAAI